MRAEPDAEPERILVLATLGAPERRLLSGRRGRRVEEAEPEPVPTARATVIRAKPLGAEPEAAGWLESIRSDEDRADAELADALRDLNTAIRAHRLAAADANAREVAAGQALVLRIGYGAGEEVADGRFGDAWELPRGRRRTKRSMAAPEERFAALLGGRTGVLAGEELVLRARSDIDAGRPREAALQARVALEALLAELPGGPADARPALGEFRADIGAAANAALRGDPPAELQARVEEAVARMEAALKRLRLDG
jgi:hypothetical protein